MSGTWEPVTQILGRVRGGKVPPILATRFEADRGEDLFGRDRLVQEVRRAILKDSSPVFGQTVFEGHTVTLAEVIDAAREVSLLAPRRLVIVRGSRIAASESEEESEPVGEESPEDEERPQPGRPEGGSDAAQIAVLDRYLKGSSSSACILFVGCPWDARRRVHKALLSAATIADVGRPDPRQMPSWIEERVREAGGRIDPDAASLLAELRGNDTLRLAGEIEKLLIHGVGSRSPISAEDVAALVGAGEGASAWALVDALAEGDAGKAVQTLRQVLEEGEPVPMIVGALASRLRQLMVLCDERGAGRRFDEARRIVFPGRSIFFADSLARQAAKFSSRDLIGALTSLYDVDRRSKSTSLDGGALLEQWLVSVLAERRVLRS